MHTPAGGATNNGSFFCRRDFAKCYISPPTGYGYWDATEQCGVYGGRLATFNTLAEYTEFNQLMLTYNSWRPYDTPVVSAWLQRRAS